MDEPEDSSSLTASEQAEANFRHLVLDIVWFGVALPATARFLSIYAIRLGATPMLLGWLAALPAIVALVTSSLAAWWRKKFPDTVTAQFWPGLGFRLVFLLPVLTPFFPAAWQPVWLILAVSLPALPQGISSVLFLVLLREGIESTHLTALISRRSLVFNIIVGVATLVFGFWLERAPFPGNYQVMYMVAFVASLISLWHVRQVRALASEPVPVAARPAIRPWRAPEFQRVAFITVIAHVAFFAVTPIIPLRLVEELGAEEGFMSLFALAELAAAAVSAMVSNRVVRRLGNRPAIALGMIGSGVAVIPLAVVSNLYLTLPAAALSGAAWTLAAISLFGFFSENTPADDVTRYSTLFNQIVSLSIFIGPMLGSQLASTSLSLTTVLWIGAALRLVAGGLTPINRVGRIRRAPRPVSAARGVK